MSDKTIGEFREKKIDGLYSSCCIFNKGTTLTFFSLTLCVFLFIFRLPSTSNYTWNAISCNCIKVPLVIKVKRNKCICFKIGHINVSNVYQTNISQLIFVKLNVTITNKKNKLNSITSQREAAHS